MLRAIETRDHLSVMSAVTPKGQLYTRVREEAMTSADGMVFLFRLVCQLGRLLVVWDRSPIHRGEVAHFLADGAARHIHLEPLPPYAPDLNPDEGVWQHIKHVEMRNICCVDIPELRLQLRLAIKRLRNKPRLLRSFFAGAKLSI